jgi:hypothetical protein
MTLNQLVSRAASVYPDGFVLEYWDCHDQCAKHNPAGGDTLAQFIAQELADTYDREASDGDQVTTAVRVMQSATDDLQAVTDALARSS